MLLIDLHNIEMLSELDQLQILQLFHKCHLLIKIVVLYHQLSG